MKSKPVQILFVDDDDCFVRIFQEVLSEAEGATFEFTRVGTLADALFRLEKETFDVILLDLGLPDDAGLPALVRVRAAAEDIPIVILTSFDEEKFALQAIHLGAQDYLTKKKLDVNLISRVIRYAITRKQVELELRTAQKEAESAVRVKTEFLRNISHEIRTPLTAILGFAEVLSQNVLGTENVEAVVTIRRNGLFLLDLITDLLDLTKLEYGYLQVEKRLCSPVHIINEVQEYMKVRAESKGLAFATIFEGSIPDGIETDSARLRQILINFVSNAIKFTLQGKITLMARAVLRDDGRSCMQFDVGDTGIGISAEQKVQIFQPFNQADGSLTRKIGGVGLGLTICKRLADLMGGEISVTSELGQGSTFRLELPLEDNASKKITGKNSPGSSKSEASSVAPTSPMMGAKILVVEDGPDNQRFLKAVLGKVGAKVTVRENGKEGAEEALQAMHGDEPYQVIIMDIQMPVMDGYEATKLLRSRGYKGPIIAFTAHAMEEDRLKCLESGCDDYAAKPIDRTTLLSLINRYLTPKIDLLQDPLLPISST